MAFIINVKPIEIERLQRKLQKQRAMEARRMKIKGSLERGIQEDPISRNKFQID